MADDDTDDTEDFSTPAMVDPFAVLIELCRIAANPKAAEVVLKKIRREVVAAGAREQRCAIAAAKLEQKQAALDARAAELDQRERAITQREDEFAASCQEARDNLAGYYNSIAEADRHIRYRILSHADLLGGYNPALQDLPSWDVLKRLVVGLPDDPPPLERDVASYPRIDVFSDVSDDPNADRHGHVFLGTLTRSTEHKRRGAA